MQQNNPFKLQAFLNYYLNGRGAIPETTLWYTERPMPVILKGKVESVIIIHTLHLQCMGVLVLSTVIFYN